MNLKSSPHTKQEDGKREGTPPNPKSSHKDLDINILQWNVDGFNTIPKLDIM
jgi:hypothetical protein